MSSKQKVQAMPGKRAAGVSKDTQINSGKAGPKGALEERPPGGNGKPPNSGPSGNEGNNTRRDFVGGPSKNRD
jgi:hypothetical protein